MKHNHRTTQRKSFLLFYCCLFSLFFTNTVFAQTSEVRGVVVDEQGNKMPGVNVMITGTTNGVVTDNNGLYQIRVPNESTRLKFSFIGYAIQEVAVNRQKVINITLMQDVKTMDEVVVIGYGKTTKKEVTGSITSLKSDNFNQGTFTDPAGLMQGKVAGLSIVNPNGSDPQASYEIILRGTNTLESGQGPLLVIDGVIGGDMKDINFQEVETIDILKDGSAAAIYGSRGTNGVIIITTKRAKKGKTTIEYQGLLTFQVAPRMVQNLTAQEFTDAINKYAPSKSGSIYDGNTDWNKAVTRSNPFSQKHNLAISGGTDQFSHRTIINVEKDQGLLKNNNLSKILARTNIQQKGFEGYLTINYNAFYSMRKYNPANYDIFYQAFIHNPTEPIYSNTDPATGGYNKIDGIQYYNPVAMLKEGSKSGETDDFGGNIRATLEIPGIKGLKFDNFYSYEKSRYESDEYRTRYYPSIIGTNGEATIQNGGSYKLQYESTLSYSGSWNRHTVQALAGYTYEENGFNSSSMSNTGYDTDILGANNIGIGTGIDDGSATMDSHREMSKLISFFGRAMYNYDEKYLLSASLRREGSSRFGLNNKWGWFPAVSLGWRMNKEDFIKNIDWISDLKLRGGYGATGNQDFGNYNSLELFKVAGKFFYNGLWINSYKPKQNPNPDLRWEKKEEINLGVDFSFLKNRVGGTVDLYSRKSTDLLYIYNVSVPPFVYNTIFTNVGIISNKGIEITLTGIPVLTKDFKWTTTLTFSKNSNILDKFTNADFTNGSYQVGWLYGDITVNTQRLQPGKSIGTFYGPVWLGTDATGHDKFKNQDSITGAVDQTKWEVIGHAYPDFVLGWSNVFTYKQWDLGFSLRASVGGNIINTYRVYYENFTIMGLKNIVKSQLDHPNFMGDAAYSSKYVEDGSYLKMDNISMGYNISIKSKYISKIRVYGAAQDVFCLTKYKGLNPEVSLSGLSPGIENLTYYPVTTGLTIGVNVTF